MTALKSNRHFRMALRRRVFLHFVMVITLFGILGTLLGVILIDRTTLNEAQRRVSIDLRSAWSVIDHNLDDLRRFVGVLGTGRRVADAIFAPSSEANRVSLEAVRRQFGLDFFALTDAEGRVILRTSPPYRTGDYLANDPFVARGLKGETASGFAILSPERLRAEGGDLEDRAFMVFVETPRAKERPKTSDASGMALMVSAPVRDLNGKILGALYGGILLNRNHPLVDKIRSIVFEDKLYKGKQLGTVTIFQWDSRIATNVTLANGNRAIGTRVSEDVYDKVLENNSHWYDRAFVVNDWYLSAYDPIRDIEGRTIGILYVGVLARRYDDIKAELYKLSGGFSAGAGVFVLAVGLIFARRLTASLSRLADGAGRIARGELDLKVPEPAADDEVRDLTLAFNAMADSLRDREERLRAANGELEGANASLKELNANYLEMLGFVSHELKNTLGVIFTSARALDSGLVGPLEKPQATLVGNIVRSIDLAVGMTRNYLDLARIEQGELRLDPRPFDFGAGVIAPLLEELESVAAERNVSIENRIPEAICVEGDAPLLRIAFKNLLVNALKYGNPGGAIRLGFSRVEDRLRFEVWNSGRGLSAQKISSLFGKFVRFPEEGESSRSTGLGLYITREIIRKHGGEISAESREGEWICFTFTLPPGKPHA